MTAGVYAIFNMSNGFVYVGSSVNIERRWKGRIWEFNRGQATNKQLQDDWLKTQGQGFEFRILEVVGSDNGALLRAEDQWMTCLRAVSPGMYNVREAAIGRYGFPMAHRGWGWPYRWDRFRRVRSRKAHYFKARGELSLCEKETKLGAFGFEDDNHDSPDNCAACRKAYALLPVPKRRRATRSGEAP